MHVKGRGHLHSARLNFNRCRLLREAGTQSKEMRISKRRKEPWELN